MSTRDHDWPRCTAKLYRKPGETQKCARCGVVRQWSRIGDRWLYARDAANASKAVLVKTPYPCAEAA